MPFRFDIEIKLKFTLQNSVNLVLLVRQLEPYEIQLKLERETAILKARGSVEIRAMQTLEFKV